MNKKLHEKIVSLFAYRKFPQLYKNLRQSYKKSSMIPLLVDVQASIYDLDKYLEENWTIKKMEINRLWREIRKSLTAVGISRNDQSQYLKRVEKYQEHELDLRKGLLPDRFSKEHYYYYKSCDVKLIREIIYKEFPVLAKIHSNADWRCFDLITEVNDDVVDLKEDMTTINGNVYLLSIIKNGLKSTTTDFLEFLNYIEEKNQSRLDKYGYRYQRIYRWTKKEVKATRKILLQNKNKYKGKQSKKQFEKCLLSKTLKSI